MCNLSLFGVVKWKILGTPHSVKVNGKGDKTDIFDSGIVYSSSRPKQHHSSLTRNSGKFKNWQLKLTLLKMPEIISLCIAEDVCALSRAIFITFMVSSKQWS